MLTRKDPTTNSYVKLNTDEIQALIQKLELSHPDIAQVFKNPSEETLSRLNVPEVPESVTIYYHWEKAAQKMLQTLWKFEGAHVFHLPVDWKTWKLFDYPEIIKNPMDFSTIKQKLHDRVYQHMNEFLDDMRLVF